MGIVFERIKQRQFAPAFVYERAITLKGNDAEDFLQWKCEKVLALPANTVILSRDFLDDEIPIFVDQEYKTTLRNIVFKFLENKLTCVGAQMVIEMIEIESEDVICILDEKRIQKQRRILLKKISAHRT